jgi:DNA-binding NtrC family response regulator
MPNDLQVLLMETSSYALLALKDFLTSRGYVPCCYSSGRDAWEALQSGVACDVAIIYRGWDGSEDNSLAKRVKELRPDLPVISTTTESTPTEAADATLYKPFPFQELEKAIQRVTRKPGNS